MYARILIIMALCSAALPRSLQATYPAGEPQIVDVLYISRGLAQGSVTHKTLGADPSIEVLGVPMPGHYSIGDLGLDPVLMNRALRMYMPRNYQQMMSERDMVVLHEAACGMLEEQGVRIRHPAAVAVLCAAGATRADEEVVHIPRPLPNDRPRRIRLNEGDIARLIGA